MDEVPIQAVVSHAQIIDNSGKMCVTRRVLLSGVTGFDRRVFSSFEEACGDGLRSNINQSRAQRPAYEKYLTPGTRIHDEQTVFSSSPTNKSLLDY